MKKVLLMCGLLGLAGLTTANAGEASGTLGISVTVLPHTQPSVTYVNAKDAYPAMPAPMSVRYSQPTQTNTQQTNSPQSAPPKNPTGTVVKVITY